MNLYLCEKPSLARNVAQALKTTGKNLSYKGDRTNGYYEGSNDIIAALYGHLMTLKDLEEYPGMDRYRTESGKAHWILENLPFLPEKFEYKVGEGNSRKLKSLIALINDDKVDTIYHLGDADREGEIIVRNVLDASRTKKPVLRVWLSAETTGAILEGIREAKPDKEYDALARAGYLRTFMDWDYGINLTRFVTLKKGELLHVGRVSSCMAKEIYDREMEIRAFVPQKYYQAESKSGGVDLTDPKRFDSKEECEKYCRMLNSGAGRVTDKKTERTTVPSPKLHSQNTLQSTMNKDFSYSPSDTLKYAQSLYENGYISYPRTNTQYLNEGEKGKINIILKAINAATDNGLTPKSGKWLYDDNKVEGHSALKPTEKLPGKLSVGEKRVYEAVLRRFQAVFCKEPCLEDRTKLVIQVTDPEDKILATFTLNGKINVSPGWKKYEKGGEEKLLPPLNVGDPVELSFSPVEKETKPPKHYTVTTFNDFLVNPFRKAQIDESDDEFYKQLMKGTEIGTTATRAPSIKQLIDRGYLTLTKKVYGITDKGITLIETLKQLGIDVGVQKTVDMNRRLVAVKNDEMELKSALQETENEIREVIGNSKGVTIPGEKESTIQREPLCLCPRCKKGQIREWQKAFSCTDKSCGFTLWKSAPKGMLKNTTITSQMAKDLISGKSVNAYSLWSEKKQRSFSGRLRLEDTGTYVNLKLDI